MKKILKELSYFVEYVGLRILVFTLQRLPYGAALALGHAVAWIAFHAVGFRVRAAESRIREVFADKYSPREIKRISWLAWRNFVFGLIDLAVAPVRGSEEILAALDDKESVEKILAHLRETGRGAIIAVPHMGAWEISAFAATAIGIPLFTMAARQKNVRADDFMNRLRQSNGAETIMRDSSLKGIIRRIRDGKVLAILPDLRSPQPGLSIRFLGKTANIAGGMGFIARQTGAPVFPTVITRIGWKRHRCRMFDPVKPDPALDKEVDALRITQAVFDVFDECIRAEPEQWFWFNKRWIFDPLD